MTKTKGRVTNDPAEGDKSMYYLGMTLIVGGIAISLTVVGAIIGIPAIIAGFLITSKAGAQGENPFECPECETKLGYETEVCPECGETGLTKSRLLENHNQKKREQRQEKIQQAKEDLDKKWKPCPECGEQAMTRDGTFNISMDGLLADLVCEECGNEEKSEDMYA